MSQEMLNAADFNLQSMATLDGINGQNMAKLPPRRIKNEQEKHAGWV